MNGNTGMDVTPVPEAMQISLGTKPLKPLRTTKK